jgi:hypothetical protein
MRAFRQVEIIKLQLTCFGIGETDSESKCATGDNLQKLDISSITQTHIHLSLG